MIDIVLVDDHRLFRDGLRRLLQTDGRFRVVGEAADGAEFLALNLSGRELIFMDIDMPGMGGIEATEKALARWPELRVVALSMHGEEEFFAPMAAAGAVGFLMKDSTLEQVVAAALNAVGAHTETTDNEELSAREREVLPLICAGLSTQQIAERLFISPRTVDKHRASILSKTGSPNTASLVVYAVKHGLISV